MKKLKIIALLSLIAMGATIWLTYLHYKPDASSICVFSEKWNCDIVNKSVWSTINIGFAEIPVAILGFFTYLIMFVGSVGIMKKLHFHKIHSWLHHENVHSLIKHLAYIGLLFSLYLTYIEIFKLHTLCLFCVIQQIIILIISLMFFVMFEDPKSI